MDINNKEINIIHECLKGNTEAFRELIMIYQQAVYATAFYYTKDSDTAKEITQETFINAFKNLPYLRDYTKFGSWLKEIATRTSIRYLQKTKEIPMVEIENEKIVPIEHKDTKSSSITIDEFKNAVEQLPERYRLPVVLKFLEGMSYEEIGRFTGESPGEIKGILQRAVKQLQNIMENYGGEMNQWQDVLK
ncbi:MAG TPA: RNA polymerase sigma factor [Candidatus Hydrogenedens sp.]|nr:RNA polymerase sigma factor [Candidatus Hydrogenedens sp.]HOK08629.1 RNA polymerase sigma factor [Candidatus Hydrogenedens sp.]HOL19889.1 RNA polymerase sigma factor [Candidatus Hydrogenedens sp.]HPP58330.1 RNA polymerase sigma factor [Candidatus Hydrogenedens sp.]